MWKQAKPGFRKRLPGSGSWGFPRSQSPTVPERREKACFKILFPLSLSGIIPGMSTCCKKAGKQAAPEPHKPILAVPGSGAVSCCIFLRRLLSSAPVFSLASAQTLVKLRLSIRPRRKFFPVLPKPFQIQIRHYQLFPIPRFRQNAAKGIYNHGIPAVA